MSLMAGVAGGSGVVFAEGSRARPPRARAWGGDDDRELAMAEAEQVRGRLAGAAGVVDVDGGVRRGTLGVDEHGRDAQPVERLEGPVVGAETQADEAVDGGLADRAFE